MIAQRWVTTVRDALRHIGAHPGTRPARCAVELKLDNLCFCPVKGFAYLVFYVENLQEIDAGRVMHEKRDIHAWMQESS